MSTLSTLNRPRALRPARLGVPWATVLTLAAAHVRAPARSGWSSLQGAIGATERTGTPFATWPDADGRPPAAVRRWACWAR